MSELLNFRSIVIQAHDNPDADAIASGYGLWLYFRLRGKKVRLIYGGSRPISKSNLVLMVKQLQIPIEHMEALHDEPDLLLTVDCQYGERNVQKFSGKTIAVIDHHVAVPEKLPALQEVRSTYGSCSTIVWDMLKEEGDNPSDNEDLATALYYGLFMDTGKMQELHHPKDKDMRDELELRLNRATLTMLQNCNLSEEELVNLTKAGFYWVQAGIESFSDGILRLMGKGASAIRQVQTMKHCMAHGVDLMWYVLVGTPGETETMCQEVNEVIPKIMHLQGPGTVAHVMFLRDSYYTEHPGGAVPELRPDMGYDFVYPDRDFIRRTALLFSPKDPQELARYYDYRQIGPAYEKLYELTETWRSTPQLLFLKDKGYMVKILDTRIIAKHPILHLTGAKAQLCRACRNVKDEKDLFRELSDQFEEHEIKESIDWLVEENQLLKIGSEYLTLAVDRDAYFQSQNYY